MGEYKVGENLNIPKDFLQEHELMYLQKSNLTKLDKFCMRVVIYTLVMSLPFYLGMFLALK